MKIDLSCDIWKCELNLETKDYFYVPTKEELQVVVNELKKAINDKILLDFFFVEKEEQLDKIMNQFFDENVER